MEIILLTCVSSMFAQRSLGAYQLAHFMREQGFSTQVIDHTDHFTPEELSAALGSFIGPETLVVGISTTFYSPSDNDKKFISNDRNKFDLIELPGNIKTALADVKQKWPKVKIVVGGAKSTAGMDIDGVDAVIHGYGEDKFLDYVRSLTEKKRFPLGTNLKSNQIVIEHDPFDTRFNIEKLEHRFAAQDLIIQGETLPIEVSRGCIFRCSFCAFPLNGKTKLDYLRDPGLIRDEMIYNYEQFGTTNYFMSDDTFNDSTLKLERLHSVITTLPFKINFTAYLRLDLLHRFQEQIQLLKEMGLVSPFFGIESLNQKSAQSIGKGMNVNKVKDFLIELDSDLWKGMPITCSFIIGLPHETKETIQASYEWIKASNMNSVWFPLSLLTKTFYKSKFNEEYEKFGYDLDLSTGYWTNEHFTYDEANELAERFNSEFMRGRDRPSSWFLMTLLNHGYTLEEAINTQIKDLNWQRILRRKMMYVKTYKQRLEKLRISYDQDNVHDHQPIRG